MGRLGNNRLFCWNGQSLGFFSCGAESVSGKIVTWNNMALGKTWSRRYSVCCYMSSSRATKTLVALRDAPGVSWLGRRQMEKWIFFPAVQKSIGMSCAPQKLGFILSYFACIVHWTKWFGCLFFWRGTYSLLFIPGLSPFLSKSKIQCLRERFWRCVFSGRQSSVRRRSGI